MDFVALRSKAFKALSEQEDFANAPEERIAEALAENGMLFRRPLLHKHDVVLIGFNAEEWAEALL